MELRCKRVHDNAILPTRSNSNDAGLDLYACDDVWIDQGRIVHVNTGIQIELPANHFGMICDKSGLASRGLKTLGGIIDEGYRGNIIVVATNLESSIFIKKGQKIAQLLVLPVAYPQVVEVNELSDSDRGSKGFGSSGS